MKDKLRKLTVRQLKNRYGDLLNLTTSERTTGDTLAMNALEEELARRGIQMLEPQLTYENLRKSSLKLHVARWRKEWKEEEGE